MNRAFYSEIKKILINARNKVYQTANFAMVEAYWQIGKSIVEEQNGEKRAEYGTGLLKELSKQMTQDFGRGFTVTNLKNMRQFYLTFPNGYALRSELSWTHKSGISSIGSWKDGRSIRKCSYINLKKYIPRWEKNSVK